VDAGISTQSVASFICQSWAHAIRVDTLDKGQQIELFLVAPDIPVLLGLF